MANAPMRAFAAAVIPHGTTDIMLPPLKQLFLFRIFRNVFADVFFADFC